MISDNDYSGDPDGLFQLVHMLLSPSLDVRAVVGSHLAVGDGFDPSTQQAANAVRAAQVVLGLMRLRGKVRVVQGSNVGLTDATTPQRSAGAQAIVDEALRTDTDLPLFVTFGAGLTELASAYLIEPRIAERLTAVWIGGPEYPELGPPGATGAGPGPEYNLNIDVKAAQVVFNESTIPVWQVPRNAYRQALVSMTELAVHVSPRGRVGAHLYDELLRIHRLTPRSARSSNCAKPSPVTLPAGNPTATKSIGPSSSARSASAVLVNVAPHRWSRAGSLDPIHTNGHPLAACLMRRGTAPLAVGMIDGSRLLTTQAPRR